MPALNDRFPACLDETLLHEGGWSDDPYDPGGATMKGVTIKVYAAHIGMPLTAQTSAVLKQQLRRISDQALADIYRRNYWDPVRCDELPPGVDFVVWDASVNSGPVRSGKFLQKALGLTADGHVGDITIKAANAADPAQLVKRIMAERRAFLRSLSTYWRFGRGWETRCDNVEAVAVTRAGSIPTTPYHAPDPNPDVQSASQGKAPSEDPKPPKGTEATLAVSGTVSNVSGFASAFGKLAALKTPTSWSVLFTFLSEPLILTGLVMTAAAVFTFLWRRKFST